MTDINILVDNETVIDDISSCKIGMSDSSYCLTVDMQFTNQRMWEICDPLSKFGTLRIKVVIGSTTYQFLLEDRNTTSSTNGAIFSIWGRSTQALLAAPFAETIKDTDSTAYIWQTSNVRASEIIEYVLDNFMNSRSVTVSWNVEDFMVYENSFSVSGQTPIDVIGSLADVVGAQLIANVDGSLSINSYSVTEGNSVASYNDLDEIFSLNESIIFPSGYNAVTVHGFGDTAVGDLADTNSYLSIQDLSSTDFYNGVETVVKCYYYHPSLVPQCYFPKGSYRYLTTGAEEITEDVTFRYGTGSTSKPNTSGKSEVTYGSAIVEVREVEYATNYVTYAIKPNSTDESVLAFYFSDRSGEVDTNITPTSSRIGTTGSGLDSLVIDWDLCGSIVFERADSTDLSPGDTINFNLYHGIGLLTPTVSSDLSPTTSSRTGLTLAKSEDVTFTNGVASVSYPITLTASVTFIEQDISFPVQWREGSNKLYCLGLFDNSDYPTVRANVSYKTAYKVFFDVIPSTYSSTTITFTAGFAECSGTTPIESTITNIGTSGERRDITITVKNFATSAVLEDVSIWIGGAYKGDTNASGQLVVSNVLVGSHSIKMTKSGYLDSDLDDIANDTFTVS